MRRIAVRLAGVAWLAIAVLALAACGGAGGSAQEAAGSGDSRTVEHAMGETEIKGVPERVVVLDTGELDSAMTLGVTPVGAVEAIPGEGFPSYLEGTGGIENVGTIEEPNLEKIAALEPDETTKKKITSDPLWQKLEAVQQGRVHEVSDDLWMLGIGYTAANGVVDDLTKYLVEK